MFIKIKLRDEVLRLVENFCKEKNLSMNKFIEKVILEKIEMETIKEKMKIGNDILAISEEDFLEEDIELIKEILENGDKRRH